MARLAKGVIVENVGPDLLLVVPGRLDALRLTGEAAEALLKIQAGGCVDSTSPVVEDLASQGVVELPGVSRRGLIKAGAVGAGAGIAVLAMPGAAAASSPSGSRGLIGTFQNMGTGPGVNVRFVIDYRDLGPDINALNPAILFISTKKVTAQLRETFFYWEFAAIGSLPGPSTTGTITAGIGQSQRQFNVTFNEGVITWPNDLGPFATENAQP